MTSNMKNVIKESKKKNVDLLDVSELTWVLV